jgi:alanyl-tRNA synthetase
MALFGEKYGDRVRVVSIPGFSVELCGGTHCRATGDIGLFTIVHESGVAAGVRRIEAITGEAAVRRAQQRGELLEQVLRALAASEDQALDAVARLHAEVKRLAKEAQDLRMKIALGGGGAQAVDDTVEIGGVSTILRRVSDLDKGALRDLADSLKSKMASGAVVLASETPDGKVAIVVTVTPDLKGRVHAGQIVKQIAPVVGGGGGGRPDFAEAGGKDPSKIDAMLTEARRALHEALAG